eukprot:3933537-Rhodomonas_salina.1
MVLGTAGIGLVLRHDLTVTSVNAGGPASLSNIQAGDRVVAVDGNKVEGWSIESVAQLICGESDTQVEVTVEKKVRASATLIRRRKQPAVASMPASRLPSGSGQHQLTAEGDSTAAGPERGELVEKELRVARREI